MRVGWLNGVQEVVIVPTGQPVRTIIIKNRDTVAHTLTVTIKEHGTAASIEMYKGPLVVDGTFLFSGSMTLSPTQSIVAELAADKTTTNPNWIAE